MNRLYIIILSILFGNLFISHAQLASQGTWNATTINATSSPGTTSPVIELTGDINQKGCITIEKGYTLTIRNVSGRAVLLQKSFNDSYLFEVKSGATLIIEGSFVKSNTVSSIKRHMGNSSYKVDVNGKKYTTSYFHLLKFGEGINTSTKNK